MKRMGTAMPRILIVDDDERLTKIIGDYLSIFGFEPELASSAAQARNCLKRGTYAVVLSDFRMPGESGLDLLTHIKSKYPGLPFILMTGLPSSTLRRIAMELGSNAFIEKPFELKDLVKTIETVLTPADGETMSMAS